MSSVAQSSSLSPPLGLHDASIDKLSYIIQEVTLITSIMRKASNHNASSNNPLSVLLNKNLEFNIMPSINGNNSNNSNSEDSRLSKFLNFNPIKPKEEENSHFLSNFIELRSMLSEVSSADEVNIMTLLQPFLILIRSPNTSNQLTSIAISSLSRFIKYQIINPHRENIEQCLQQIITSLSHCKFEGLDQVQDDILLIKILQLIELIILRDELADLLNDDSMYEAISTCFSLSINSRRREILRSSAETTLLLITEKVFKKLFYLSTDVNHENHNKKNSNVIELTNSDLPKDTIGTIESSETNSGTPQPESDGEQIVDEKKGLEAEENKGGEEKEQHEKENIEVDSEVELTPYGIPCLKEFLSHTIDILSPDNKLRFTESSRLLALNIINTIIEVSNKAIHKYPALFNLISNNLCHHLIIILQNNESPILLTASMQLFLNLALNLYNHLKLQVELMFITIFQSIYAELGDLESVLKYYNDKVLNMSSNGIFKTEMLTDTQIGKMSKEFQTNRSPTTKEIFIESISVLWIRSPLFFINLYKSYDCDFDRTDLSETLINLLFRLSYSNTTIFITNNVPPLSMEGILAFVDDIYERVKLASKNNHAFTDSVYTNPDNLLLHQKIKKSDFIECTKEWNKKPAKGLELLQAKGFIKDKDDVKEVAKFLFDKSGRLDKKQLGETLAKPSNNALLVAFIDLLDFKRLRVDEALRILLANFRIPGESQLIERIVDVFGERYIHCQNEADEEDKELESSDPSANTTTDNAEKEEKVSPDKDAVFVLSYSIIMLNTDLFNPNVKEPMTFEQYQRNLRGVYFGGDFPVWYLKKIYDGIKEKEIILPEEHKGTSKWFESVWSALLNEQESKKSLITDNSSESKDQDHILLTHDADDYKDVLPFDKLLFSKTFNSLIGAFITMFDDTFNDSIVTRMMSTIEKCASITSFFGMHDELDKIIEIITHMTTLTGIKKPDTSSYDDNDQSRNSNGNSDKDQSNGNDSNGKNGTNNNGDDNLQIPITELKLEKENEVITISEKAVYFGKDFRAQLSTIVLFRILKKSNFKIYENSWKYIFKVIFTLFENRLIDPNIFTEFQEQLSLDKLSLPKPQFQINRTKALKDTGLFSTFSSYFKGLADDTPEPTDEEIECTLSTIDCLKSSKLSTIFRNLTKKNNGEDDEEFEKNIILAIKLLLESLPERKDENLRFFAEESLFIYEIIVCYMLLINNNNSAKHELVQKVLESMQVIFTPMSDFKVSTLTRVFCYKLLLLQNSDGSASDIEKLDAILKEVVDFLNTSQTTPTTTNSNKQTSSVSKEALIKFGVSILQPLETLAINPNWTQSEVTKNKNYWNLIRIFSSNPKNTDNVYKFMEVFVKKSSKYITASNFLDILGLLDEISAVGAYGAQWEQEYDQLKSSGHEIEKKGQNPYHELVSTALKSLTLTSSLSKIITSDEFRVTVSKDENEIDPWYPLIEAIAHQCYNPCRELRSHALKALQSLLVNQDELPISKDITPEKILDTGCIRLFTELLKPEVESTDPKGMIKTQYEVLNLACKIILIYNFENNTDSASKLLTLSNRFLVKHSTAKNKEIDAYSDEVLEMMKNVLLVLMSKNSPLDFNILIKLNIQMSFKKIIKDVGLQYQQHISRTSSPAPVASPAPASEELKVEATAEESKESDPALKDEVD